jgi:hypothetical protein
MGAFELYQFGYGPLTLPQRDGFAFLIASMSAEAEITDIRWAAYMLATVKHECSETWRPIEEYGRGIGRPYGKPVTVIDDQGVPHDYAYFGRGYVQLTWQENYQKMGQALGIGDGLMLHPELALDPGTAYKIMSYGMRNGSFTGARLGTYISGPKADYEKARQIINGTDRASRIADYARELETILIGSVDGTHGTD